MEKTAYMYTLKKFIGGGFNNREIFASSQHQYNMVLYRILVILWFLLDDGAAHAFHNLTLVVQMEVDLYGRRLLAFVNRWHVRADGIRGRCEPLAFCALVDPSAIVG